MAFQLFRSTQIIEITKYKGLFSFLRVIKRTLVVNLNDFKAPILLLLQGFELQLNERLQDRQSFLKAF